MIKSLVNFAKLLFKLIFAVAFVAAVFVVGVAVGDRSPPTVVHSTPAVVLAVQHLARLATVEFHLEHVIDNTDPQRALFGLVQTQDSILMVAVADVTAGVDLAGLRPQDVVVDEARNHVTVHLPAPTVFTVAMDNVHTRVYSRQTGVLAQRNESLESRTRTEAVARLRQAAIDGGILDHARTGAERMLRALMLDLGFETVEVTWEQAGRP